MKNIIINSVLTALLILGFSSHAGLYKGLDEEGNVVYSDEPFYNAKEITPPTITVVQPIKVPEKPTVVEEEVAAVETIYSKFYIATPKNNETIWNQPQLVVSLKLTPELDSDNGHNIWLLLDGKTVVKNSSSQTLQINRIDRGLHSIQAQLRDKQGKIIRSTQLVTLHIKHTLIPKKSAN